MLSVLKADLREDGWLWPHRAVGFYSCDKHVSTSHNDCIDLHGDHNTYYSKSPCSPVCSTHENGTSGHVSHNRNTDLRHLAYHLAWFIYDNYSKTGQDVQIVAHSMGGLIVRWMLYAEANNATVGQGVFPPVLYVQDVYTISTPHNGTGYAFLGGFYQAQEMQTGSAFLNALNGSASGRNPQGTNGTDWTTMGNYPSDSDFVVTDTSAVYMDGGHKGLFSSPRYSHGGLLAVALHWLSEIVHHLGHAIAARRTGYPMSGIRLGFLGVLTSSVYPRDEPELPPALHIQRALGGPLASLAIGLVAGALALALHPSGGLAWC